MAGSGVCSRTDPVRLAALLGLVALIQLQTPAELAWSRAAAPAHRDALHRPGERSAGRSEPLTTPPTRNLGEWAGGASPPRAARHRGESLPPEGALDLASAPCITKAAPKPILH